MTGMFSNFFENKNTDTPPSAEDRQEEVHPDVVIEQLTNRIALLEKRMAALEKQFVELTEQKNAQTEIKPKVECASTKEQTDSDFPTRFFLAAPTTDGVFSHVSAVEQIGKSIYQLTTTDGVNGSFILLDTPDAIATAMISVSQFIKPACKVNGNMGAFPRHIVTEEEGTAVKDGMQWKVMRKAQVRFE